MERIETGIPGFDDMIEGGLKKGSAVLVGGGCGTGKSTMCMQFLYHGAKKGEAGVYISFEEKPEEIRENMALHGWSIADMESNNLLEIIHVNPQEVMHIINDEYGTIMDSVERLQAQRIVVDSLTSIEMMIESEHEKRQSMLKFLDWLKWKGCTSMLTAEAEQDPKQYSRYGVLEFIVDGVVVLYNIRRGKSRVRALEVLKMRGTHQNTNLVPYVINEGIKLQPSQPIFGNLE